MSKYNVKEENSLQEIEKHLTEFIFLGGLHPGAEDALVLEQFGQNIPSVEQYPYTFSWYTLVYYYQAHIKESWKAIKPVEKGGKHHSKGGETKPQAKGGNPNKGGKPNKKSVEKKDEGDDFDDMFGEVTEEDKKLTEERNAKKKEQKKLEQEELKKEEVTDGKPKVIAKSIILFDIKGWESDQDFDELAQRILKIEAPGLFWKTEYKISEICFGVNKLTMGCVVEDEICSIDDIIEIIEGWEEVVQSTDIVSFNKI